MSRNLSPMLRRELANLDKDADSRRSAMKALKTYVKDLNPKAIPDFLAQVSETKEQGSPSKEYTISLYEVLARVHGRNIVPQIDNIMSTIIRTLSSSAGCFPLHQACSKVVPAIARYGIDPSTPDDEKAKIICSLCKPLSDALMGSQESAASGAALCLKALVESDNWRFASDDIVNEVCLKVAGALEEKPTQTNSHTGLVIALAKHNGLIAEAYARSFLRSGLQILTVGSMESNSQKRLSAIQMVNFLMKCMDIRTISSELPKVVDIMEKCHDDHMPFVRGAAFEALQTAKLITGQKRSKHEICSSPIIGSNFRRNARKNSGASSPAGFASPESQTVDSFVDYDGLVDSPISIGQACNFEYANRSSRRLWGNDKGGVDISFKDGLFLKACSGSDGARICFEHFGNGETSDIHKEQSDAFSGFVQSSATNTVTRDTTPCPTRSQPQLIFDDVKLYSTPRKLIRSLQDPVDANSEDCGVQYRNVTASPTSYEVKWNSAAALNGDSHSHNMHYGIEAKKNARSMKMPNKLSNVQYSDLVADGTESVSSTGNISEGNADKLSPEVHSKDMNGVARNVSIKSRLFNKAALSFLCVISVTLVAILLSAISLHNDEFIFDIPPT